STKFNVSILTPSESKFLEPKPFNISGLHSYYSKENEIYKNILPPLSLLNKTNENDLVNSLKKLNFTNNSSLAA
ncbi:hypothetical protein IDH11_01430, partial [Pelagibacterales bacterium SAG-MED30]|nr:hypothetical protein [Pelagibacterales bacterium SAG-MED30]